MVSQWVRQAYEPDGWSMAGQGMGKSIPDCHQTPMPDIKNAIELLLLPVIHMHSTHYERDKGSRYGLRSINLPLLILITPE
jgi:hypothetical protein